MTALPDRMCSPRAEGWYADDLDRLAKAPRHTGPIDGAVVTRPVGERPFVELEPTGPPLAVEQRTGISLERVREIASTVLHAGDGEGGRG
ncbi:hypothetical protein FKN01_15155 [Streptomyces sp. 130]|uniref:DUF2199 domain-containing protein n=1 Tax=Streptomyces sp. 130 TaxID=2591006 RepID=UPI00117C8D49|nr:hypothetical protein FKN01_15155 [Streptomyces sp. 130]